MPRLYDKVLRFSVQPLDDPGYEDLWGIYDFVNCEWAGSLYGDRYQSESFDTLSDIAGRLNEVPYDHSTGRKE